MLEQDRSFEERLHYVVSLRLYLEDKAFGPGIAALLRGVERTGSLLKAAQSMGMAYSKAWKILRETEGVWGFPLTERETGGKDGGGSTLTPQALTLLTAYESFAGDAKAELDRLFAAHFPKGWGERIGMDGTPGRPGGI